MQGGENATLNASSISQIQHIGDLSNKIALVTGASSGLGRAISQAFAAAGAYVVSADLTPNPPKTPILENTMKASGVDLNTPTVDLVNARFPSTTGNPRMMYVQTDVTSSASVEAAVAFAVQKYGRLDIMVNNAGISAEAASVTEGTSKTHELSEAAFDKDMAINVKGVWLGIKHAVGQMLKQEPHSSGDRGWIINLCSIMGLIALSGAGPYCASKGKVLPCKSSNKLIRSRCCATAHQSRCTRIRGRPHSHQLYQPWFRRDQLARANDG